MKSLDIGCGLTPKGPEGWEHYGVDIVPSDNPNVRQANLILERIPFEDNLFDRVEAHDFVEHVPKIISEVHNYGDANGLAYTKTELINPVINLFNEIYRVLKHDGTFFCSVPQFPTWGAIADPQHCCFSDDTEVLTKEDGWLPITKVQLGDYVLTVDLDSELAEYQPVSQLHSYFFDGEMRHFKTKSMDLLVTPNHNMVRTTKPISIKSHRFEMRRADWFDDRSNKSSIFPQNIKLKDEPEILEKIFINGIYYPAKEFMRFMGWFLAEGWIYSYPDNYQHNIYIAQSESANPKNCKEIFDTMYALGLNPHWDVRRQQIIAGNKSLVEWLKQCGSGAENKYIPAMLKQQNRQLLEELLSTAIKGDACSWGTSYRYSSTSYKLASDISEIAQKCGYRATQTYEKRSPKILGSLGYSHTTDQKDIWHVYISKKQSLYSSSTKVKYQGTVVSVGVEKYHTLYVRRNGRAVWSGNSFWIPDSLNYLSGDYFGFHDHYGHTSRFEKVYCNPAIAGGIHMQFELRAVKNVPDNHPYLIKY